MFYSPYFFWGIRQCYSLSRFFSSWIVSHYGCTFKRWLSIFATNKRNRFFPSKQLSSCKAFLGLFILYKFSLFIFIFEFTWLLMASVNFVQRIDITIYSVHTYWSWFYIYFFDLGIAFLLLVLCSPYLWFLSNG